MPHTHDASTVHATYDHALTTHTRQASDRLAELLPQPMGAGHAHKARRRFVGSRSVVHSLLADLAELAVHAIHMPQHAGTHH